MFVQIASIFGKELTAYSLTSFQVIFKKLYPNDYTTDVSTRVSNALLVGVFAYLPISEAFYIYSRPTRCYHWSSRRRAYL